VASPFGSTGYNHSLGGALLAEDSGMALSLLAPIRNRVFHPLISSLVAEDKDTIGIEIVNDVNFELAGDMKILSDLQGKTFTISKSQACFSLAHSRDFSFYKRMRKAFLE
jgi:NAD+ kinase